MTQFLIFVCERVPGPGYPNSHDTFPTVIHTEHQEPRQVTAANRHPLGRNALKNKQTKQPSSTTSCKSSPDRPNFNRPLIGTLKVPPRAAAALNPISSNVALPLKRRNQQSPVPQSQRLQSLGFPSSDIATNIFQYRFLACAHARRRASESYGPYRLFNDIDPSCQAFTSPQRPPPEYPPFTCRAASHSVTRSSSRYLSHPPDS